MWGRELFFGLIMKFALTVLMVLISPFSFTNEPEYLELEGLLLIWGEQLPDAQYQDLDGFSLFITGEAAERLYKKMKVKPIYDDCLSDGTYTKAQGVFSCRISPKKTYACSIGVSTKEGEIQEAESC